MARPREVAERDHDIQNPTSPEKIQLLGSYLRLTSDSRVLDIACGRCGPAIVLADTYGCQIVGVEKREAFAADARRRIAAKGLEALIEVQVSDAADLVLEPEAWDAALCIGAAFVWGTISDAAAALAPTVRRGGFVAVGEPYWRTWPLPTAVGQETFAVGQEDFVSLDATVARFEQRGSLATTGIIAASDDDWDQYKSLQWRAMEEWLSEHHDDPDVADIRAEHERLRSDYFEFKRALLGWAIFIGRKT